VRARGGIEDSEPIDTGIICARARTAARRAAALAAGLHAQLRAGRGDHHPLPECRSRLGAHRSQSSWRPFPDVPPAVRICRRTILRDCRRRCGAAAGATSRTHPAGSRTAAYTPRTLTIPRTAAAPRPAGPRL